MHLTLGTVKLVRKSNRFLIVTFFMSMVHGGTPSSSLANEKIGAPMDYQSWSAEKKREWIWEEGIKKSQYSELPAHQDIKIVQMMMSCLKPKMEHGSDFIPEKWKKPIHRRAVVAKVRYIPEAGQPFAGLFAEGGSGLLRTSLTYTPEKRGVAPGMALKIFRDGKPSIDASFLTGLDSQGQNYNFFTKTFSNYVPESKSTGARLVAWIFSRVSRPTNFISVQHFSEGRGPAPHQVFLKASSEIHFAEQPARDVRLDFMGLRSGTTVLEVFARSQERGLDFEEFTEEKSRAYEAQAVKIGRIVMESEFIASDFGDDQLFFRHERALAPAAEKTVTQN
jgi:hypothetical protein